MAEDYTHQTLLIENLCALIDQQPEKVVLRLQLAQLRLAAEQYAEALALCQGILSQEPAHIEAMRCAAAAARALEDVITADGYARLLAALAPTEGMDAV